MGGKLCWDVSLWSALTGPGYWARYGLFGFKGISLVCIRVFWVKKSGLNDVIQTKSRKSGRGDEEISVEILFVGRMYDCRTTKKALCLHV